MSKESTPFYFYEKVNIEKAYNPVCSPREIDEISDSSLWKDLVYFLHKERSIAQGTLEDPQVNIIGTAFARGQIEECKIVEREFIIWLKAVKEKRIRETEKVKQ